MPRVYPVPGRRLPIFFAAAGGKMKPYSLRHSEQIFGTIGMASFPMLNFFFVNR
jgi:hypothetical protein